MPVTTAVNSTRTAIRRCRSGSGGFGGGGRRPGGGGGFQGFEGADAGDLSDLFEGLFGGGGGRGEAADPSAVLAIAAPQKGADIAYRLTVPFVDAATLSAPAYHLADGKTIDLKLPNGVEEGTKIRLAGKGDQGPGATATAW